MSHWGKTGFNLPNPIDHGARPGVDATAAIQAAIDDAIGVGAGGVFLPGGVWTISRNAATDYCLRINGATNFRFVGTGWASVLKLADGDLVSSPLSMVKVTGGCQNVLFELVTFDGNRGGSLLNINEFYGLNVDEATDTTIQNVRFVEMPANIAEANGALRVGTNAVLASEAIAAVNTGLNRFEVAGSGITAFILPGDTFEVVGSTDNDGVYTVSTITFVGPNTEIVTIENVGDATADGSIFYSTTRVSQIILSGLTFRGGDGVALLAATVEDVLQSSDGVISDFVDGVVIKTTSSGTAPRDYRFANWQLEATDHAFLATLESGTAPQRIELSGAQASQGRVVVENGDDVLLADSFFDGQVSGECVAIREMVGDVLIANCQFSRSNSLLIEAGATESPDRVAVQNCFATLDSAGFFVRIEGGDEVTIDSCYAFATAVVATQFVDLPLTNDIESLALRSCTFLGGSTVSPIKIAPGDEVVGEIFISSNTIQGDPTKVAIDFVAPVTGSYNNIPVIVDNNFEASSAIALAAFANFPVRAYIAGGNGRTDGTPAQYCATVYVVDTPPTFSGYKGEQAFDLNGSTGSTWYVNELDNAAGWVAK